MSDKRTGGVTVAEIDAMLPRTFYVTRGSVAQAFGFSKRELRALIAQGVFRAEYPFGSGRRARFVRSQVLKVAKNWEA